MAVQAPPQVLKVVDLHFAYAEQSVLEGLSFEVARGEVFGLLGPSGSGKTTTQHILLGLQRGFSGRAQVFGQPVEALRRDFYNRVGVSFELPALYLRLTALENLRLFASLFSVPIMEPRQALALVGLEGDAHKRVDRFSKGMKMRLNLCRALINDPDLLFLDEPTAGQDPSRARQTRALILELKRRGKTIFLTTHNMPEADEVCDRVAFLIDGKAKLVGEPPELKRAFGSAILRVETRTGEREDFPLEGLADHEPFLRLLRSGDVVSMHSQEATLDDVFVTVAGSST